MCFHLIMRVYIMKIKSEIRVYKGAPRLFVNDKLTMPSAYFMGGLGIPVQQEMIKNLSAQGIHIFTAPIDVGWYPAEIDEDKRFRNVMHETSALINADKQALLMPKTWA